MSHGEMGVGALIMLIALLFVAATAASVLIQTTGSLQQKAQLTGRMTVRQVSTNIMALEVSASDGRSEVTNLRLTLKLNSGADPVLLNTIVITLETKDTSTIYYYSGDDSSSVTGDNGTFGVTYLEQGSRFQPGALSQGDLVLFTVQAPRPLLRSEHVQIRCIPEIGLPLQLLLSMPGVYTTTYVHLYP